MCPSLKQSMDSRTEYMPMFYHQESISYVTLLVLSSTIDPVSTALGN